MDAAQRRQVRDKILLEIDKSEKDVVAFRALIKPIPPDNAVGRLSRMEAITAKSVNEAACAAAERKLAGLKRALGLVDHEEFAICRQCGDSIPLARILVMPEVILCVDCAERLT